MPDKKIVINYTNWKNKTSDRVVTPISVWFGVSEWHEGEQWFLKAIDESKAQERDFALLSINMIKPVKNVSDVFNVNPIPNSRLLKSVKLYTDGGSRGNPGPSAIGYVVMDMDNQIIEKQSKYLGVTTNNQAEYQGLKEGLDLCRKLQVSDVRVHMDSLLVVNQMKGIYKVKNRDLWPIHEAIKELVKTFTSVTFTHVPRELNKDADTLVNECLDAEIE